MKKRLAWLVLGVLFAGAGGGIYAQGEGYFWPCEALSANSTCEEVFHVEGRSLRAMALRPDGFVSLVSRGAGTDPDTSLMVHVVRPQSGAVMEEIPVTALSPQALPSTATIDDAGARMALAGVDFVVVTDLAGRLQQDLGRGLPAYMGFDAQERLLIYQGNANEALPSAENVLSFDATTFAPVETGEPLNAGMFAHGLNLALSPDGTLAVQNMADKASDGMAAIRLVGRNRPDAAGRLLSAELGDGCSYSFVDLAFSPNGAHLAATFDCQQRWGREGAALVIWDVADGSVTHRIPTRHDWNGMLWVDQATLMLTRYDVEAQRAALFRVAVEG